MDYLHLIITDIVFETSEPIALHFVDQDVTDDFVDFLAQSPTIRFKSKYSCIHLLVLLTS